jgi:hypothetical protein
MRCCSAGIFVCAFLLLAAQNHWTGKWQLDLKRSTIGAIWGPGIPDGLTILDETLQIEESGETLEIAGDVVMSDPRFSGSDRASLNLDGKATNPRPGITTSLQRIDDLTFDIIVKFDDQLGTNRFAFSRDGATLTETKTHAERRDGVVTRISTMVLVFDKVR